MDYTCGKEKEEETGKGEWRRGRGNCGQIMKGPVHHISEYGLYHEITWKL